MATIFPYLFSGTLVIVGFIFLYIAFKNAIILIFKLPKYEKVKASYCEMEEVKAGDIALRRFMKYNVWNTVTQKQEYIQIPYDNAFSMGKESITLYYNREREELVRIKALLKTIAISVSLGTILLVAPGSLLINLIINGVQ